MQSLTGDEPTHERDEQAPTNARNASPRSAARSEHGVELGDATSENTSSVEVARMRGGYGHSASFESASDVSTLELPPPAIETRTHAASASSESVTKSVTDTADTPPRNPSALSWDWPEEETDVIVELINPHLGPHPHYRYRLTPQGYYVNPRGAPNPPSPHLNSYANESGLIWNASLSLDKTTPISRPFSPTRDASDISQAWDRFALLVDGKLDPALDEVLEVEAHQAEYHNEPIDTYLETTATPDLDVSRASKPRPQSILAGPKEAIWKMPVLLRRSRLCDEQTQTRDMSRPGSSAALLSNECEPKTQQDGFSRTASEFHKMISGLKGRMKRRAARESSWSDEPEYEKM